LAKKQVVLKEGKKILTDFKTFISRGNVIDLAVGVMIGGAFSKIVSSLVNDILMPVIGIFIGKVDFSMLSWQVIPATEQHAGISVPYGAFLGNVLDFLLVSIAVFAFVKIFEILRKKKESADKESPAMTKQEELLAEIRDLLKQQNDDY